MWRRSKRPIKWKTDISGVAPLHHRGNLWCMQNWHISKVRPLIGKSSQGSSRFSRLRFSSRPKRRRKKNPLQLHFECLCAFVTLCEQFQRKMRREGDGAFCHQNKFYSPRSRDALDFRNVAPQGRESCSKWRERTKPDCSVWLFVAPPIMNPHSV